ncbi:MAG: radical SAM/SPASM family putative metalloenzyme maturase [Desulfopila sp.]
MHASYPQKIYVELTSRCNLQCRMCVKYAPGSRIIEEDLPFSLFRNLDSAIAQAGTLILNGIGEPLLHPQLLDIVIFSRKRMAPQADEEKSLQLLSAGLSTICLSLDSLAEEEKTPGGEHSVRAVSRAIAGLAAARKQTGSSSFMIGLEMVLSRENINDLPRYIQWAAEQGVDYVIVTHLFLYNTSAEQQSLFNPNSSEAIELFHSSNERARARGLDLREYPSIYLKYRKNEMERAVVEIFQEMQDEARDRGIFLHLQSLLQHTSDDEELVEQVFAAARAVAEGHGIELFLPPNQALAQRSCPFMADEAVFIAANGAVMPCHFLWHTYACRVLGEEIQVQECAFGTIREQPLEDIWQSRQYTLFRREAGEYDYSSCWSCTQGPCADLINDNIHAANDCYGSQVPCGHCQWNLGGVRCL